MDGLASLDAQSCGACHAEIAAEWRRSTHAFAWTDAQFQAELNKEGQPRALCVNCHVPAADQQQDETWRAEGVSCASCHVRDGAIAGPYGSSSAPHEVRLDPSLRSVDTCTACHEAQATLSPTLVCTFATGSEREAARVTQTCQECHMEAVSRPIVTGGPVREGRRHFFAGSGIPKSSAHDPVALEGLEVRLEAAPGGAALVLKNVGAGHMLPSGDPERFILATVTVQGPGGNSRSTIFIGQRWRWWPQAEKLADNRLAPGEERRFSLRAPPGSRVEAVVEHHRISKEVLDYHKLTDYPAFREVARLLLGT